MDNENKSFSCVLCDSKLSSKEALQEHFRKHANKEIDGKGKPIPKTYPTGEANDISTSSKAEKETVECDVCFMKFETVTLAIQHKFRKHPESSSKFYCPFCGMQFPLKFTRDKHVQSHSGMSSLGSFPCPDCGVIFHNMGAQTYHVKSTHKRIMSIFKPVPTPPPSKKIKINNANEAQSVYYCYLCGSEYIIKFNLQKHLERSHTEEERNSVPQDLIKCTTCDALFYNKKAYDTHNIYHKPDDLYVTSEEQRLQTISRVDQDFDIRRVQLAADKFIPVDKPKQRRKPPIDETKSKEKSLFKSDLDEELSPTSSVDSSDSETDNKSLKNDKSTVINKSDNSKEQKEANTEINVEKSNSKSIELKDSIQNKVKTLIDNEVKDSVEDIKEKMEDIDVKMEVKNEKVENLKEEIKHSSEEMEVTINKKVGVIEQETNEIKKEITQIEHEMKEVVIELTDIREEMKKNKNLSIKKNIKKNNATKQPIAPKANIVKKRNDTKRIITKKANDTKINTLKKKRETTVNNNKGNMKNNKEKGTKRKIDEAEENLEETSRKTRSQTKNESQIESRLSRYKTDEKSRNIQKTNKGGKTQGKKK